MAKVPFKREGTHKISDIKPKTNKTREQVVADFVIAKNSIGVLKGKMTKEEVRQEVEEAVVNYKKRQQYQSLEQQ